jgi:hypothetical protein
LCHDHTLLRAGIVTVGIFCSVANAPGTHRDKREGFLLLRRCTNSPLFFLSFFPSFFSSCPLFLFRPLAPLKNICNKNKGRIVREHIKCPRTEHTPLLAYSHSLPTMPFLANRTAHQQDGPPCHFRANRTAHHAIFGPTGRPTMPFPGQQDDPPCHFHADRSHMARQKKDVRMVVGAMWQTRKEAGGAFEVAPPYGAGRVWFRVNFGRKPHHPVLIPHSCVVRPQQRKCRHTKWGGRWNGQWKSVVGWSGKVGNWSERGGGGG